MAITNVAGVADAYTAGRHWSGYLRRAGPAMTAGLWTDLSYAAGIPVANYYAATPLVATQLSANEGIVHGPPVNAAGYKKYLHTALLLPPATSVGTVTALVHDIVAVYPFVDGDGGSQDMVNNLGTLRYDGGTGCKIMLVSQGAGVADAVAATITYTSSAGVQRTITPVWMRNTASAGQLLSPADAAALGVLNYNTPNPYLNLLAGDTGINSIDNINFPTAVGGIFAACIVKPLGTISWQELLVPIEVDYMRDRLRLSEVEDGAYVHMIARGTVTASPTTLHGEFSFVWG
jgi:hypothetical protein